MNGAGQGVHEQVVARVSALGEGAEHFALGDRVGVAWLHRSCGRCRFCAAGRENLVRGIRALRADTRGRVLALSALLGVDPDRVLGSDLASPGEARKLAIASGLGRRPWVLVLDEPTNHLDLPSIERLERALVAYPGALLMVTHDDALAAAATDATWTIVDGKLVT